ncbi:hypothetical protein DIE19_33205 [Burkholderia sp. Bp9126]|nr:hypothetical protein DIE19_33205 [Burkholderia sp. Bp9126]
MAVYFYTSKPQALLNSFEKKISQEEVGGKIATWEKYDKGDFYTHKAKDWHRLAWFRPMVEPARLTFHIVRPKDKTVDKLVYAYYHGHLIETFLNHFGGVFTKSEATAIAVAGDDVSAK